MSYLNILKGAVAIAGLAIAGLVALWNKILSWAQNSLFPWIERNLPTFIDIAKEAFIQFDDKVAVPIRRGIKLAWEKLRKQLLKIATYLEKKSASKWVSRTVSWVIKTLDSKQVVKIEVEEEVNWDDLPSDVKEAYIRNNQDSTVINTTEIRDAQVKQAMSLEM